MDSKGLQCCKLTWSCMHLDTGCGLETGSKTTFRLLRIGMSQDFKNQDHH